MTASPAYAHDVVNPLTGSAEEYLYDTAARVTCRSLDATGLLHEESFQDGVRAELTCSRNGLTTLYQQFAANGQIVECRQYRGENNLYRMNYPTGAQFSVNADQSLGAAEFIEGLHHTNILHAQRACFHFLQEKQALTGLTEAETLVLAGLAAMQKPASQP